MLGLPFRCEQAYKDRLLKLNLLPLTYWHEYLDLVFFLKIVNRLVDFDQSVSPTIRSARPTRSTISSVSVQFLDYKCKTATFQSPFWSDQPAYGTL